MRRDFKLSAKPSKAHIYTAVLGIYELRINGKRVGGINSAEEKLSYSNSVAVQCFDVAPLLVKGVNTIGVILANGQYCGPLKSDPSKICVFGYETHLRAQLEMSFADGSSGFLSTDNRWQGTYQFAVEYAGVIDGKNIAPPKEIAGWDKPTFKCNDKWDKALINRAVECNLRMP